VFALLFSLPFAKGLCLQVVDLGRPVPGHFNDLGDGPKVKVRFRLFSILLSNFPEKWFICLGRVQPFFALFCPIL
jgi:hypothetical protein